MLHQSGCPASSNEPDRSSCIREPDGVRCHHRDSGSASTLGFMSLMNVGNFTRYLKIYNKASAPTVGTDVPIYTFSIPPLCTTYIPLPSQGLRGATGLAFAITGGAADADTTAITAGEIFAAYGYV